MGKDRGHCGGCCGGCGSQWSLTQAEENVLRQLSQIPFLPVGMAPDSALPVYLEAEEAAAPAYGAAILGLQQKGLIQLDSQRPLGSFSYEAYGACSRRGSMALTARGQAVVELLEIQGIEE